MLIALVALGAMGTFVYFKVYKEEEAQKKTDEKSSQAFEFDKTKVKSVSLLAKGGTTKIDKVGDTWQITSPVQARADKSAVEAIVDKLADLKAKNLNEASKGKLPPAYLVSDAAADLSKFGFDQPQWGATIVLDDGKQLSLQVGAENQYDKSLYFRRGDENKVYLGDAGVKYPLDKTLFDLRDKAIVTQEDKDVMAITVEGNGTVWSAERQGEGWKVTAPVQDNGDKQTIEGVLTRIHAVRAKSFPAESLDPKDTAKYGFDKPVAQITFLVGADKAKKVLLLGETGEENKRGYAHLVEGGPVEEIDINGLGKEILKSANDLRDKTIVVFPRDKVTKIEVIPGNGEKFVINRTKEKAAGATFESDKFTLEGRPDKLKTWKMSSALYALSAFKGAAITEEAPKDLAKYGLDKPAFTYVVTLDGGQEAARVLLGNASGTRYYVKTAAGTRVYEVEKASVNELPKTPDELIDAPPAPAKEEKKDDKAPTEAEKK
jgi:hypothetical protein